MPNASWWERQRRTWSLRLRALLQRDRVEGELDEELRDHLARQIEAHVHAGLTPDEARYAALRQMGGIEQGKEAVRDARRLGLVDNLSHDVRDGVRTLRRHPGFALLGILVMALGIGANTAVFSVVRAVLLKPLVYHDPDRFVTLTYAPTQHRYPGILAQLVAAPDVKDWEQQSTVFAAMAYYSIGRSSVMSGSAAEYATVSGVSADFFRVIGVTPIAGRTFSAEENRLGGGAAALISQGYAQQHFGEPARAIGRPLQISGRALTIVGVLPAGHEYPVDTDIWFSAEARPARTATIRGSNNSLAVARLKPDVSLERAQAEMTTIGRRLQQLYPDTNRARDVIVTRIRDGMVGDVQTMLYLLLGAAGVLLLIACANMATLLLARATARAQEMAVRAALGANRVRLVRQLLVEGLVHALASGVVAALVAVWGTKLLVALAPASVPRIAETAVDLPVLGFTFGVCVVVSLLFSLPPALQAARLDTQEPLRSGGTRTIVGGRAGRLREGLVIAEIALSVVLLAGGGLLLRSLLALQQVPLGFDPERVLVMDLTPPPATGADAERERNAFFKQVMDDVAALPGVTAVGATMAAPGHIESTTAYFIDHLPKVIPPDARPVVASIVAPGAFEALGIPLTRGRDFHDGDRPDAPFTAVINETLAREAFRGQDPLGHTIYCLFDSFKPMTIIGVVGDVRQGGPAEAPRAECYMPYTQHGYNNATLSLVIRSATDPALLADTVQRTARARSAAASTSISTMSSRIAGHWETPKFRTVVVGLFAAVALCLALAGVYGVMAYVVGQRATEIGLRMALGATAGSVLWLLLRRGLAIAGLGLVLGLLGAFAATRVLSTLLFEIQPGDLPTYAAVAALLGLMSVLAIYLPARRALSVDPLVALRQE